MSECLVPSDITDSPIQRAFLYAYDNCIPYFVTFKLGLGCNLKCVHCYNFDRQGPLPEERKANQLKPDEVLRIIDELADEGTFVLSFTGGEALLHPHLNDFIRHARRRNLYVRIKSNGTLLTPKRTQELSELGVAGCDISVYGATASVHDAFTGAAGSFEKTVQGIRNARDNGLDPKLSFILHRANYSQLEAMRTLAASLNVPYQLTTEITSRNDATTSSRDHQLTEDQFKELLLGPSGSMFYFRNTAGSVQCPCARANCGISSTGEVYPCIGAPIASGNLREQSFGEIWKNSPELNRIRNLTLDDFPSCKPCLYRQNCSRSSGNVYCSTGDYTGPETSTCAQAKARFEYEQSIKS